MSVEAPDRISERFYPTEEEYLDHLGGRRRKAQFFQVFCLSMLTLAVLALATLLYTIINDSFGLTAVVNLNDPDEVVASLGHDPGQTTIDDLSHDELVTLLEANISTGVGRRLEREQRFYEDRLVFEPEDSWIEICSSDAPPEGCTRSPRSHSDLVELVHERVIAPDVIASNPLVPSILDPEGFRAEVAAGVESGQYGDVSVDQVAFDWRAWLNWDFVTSPASDTPESAGIRTAILGSAWLVLITVLFAVPVGVGAAIYLVEFARPSRFNDFVQTNINNLAGVPSIVYGMLGLAIFVRAMEAVTQGRSILSAGLTLGLLTLPVVIISSEEALKAVPDSLRHAGLGLGATRWQTVRAQVLPVAMPGILTGTILAVARAIGETAPLILVGAAGFITSDPTGPFSSFTALPIQIFQWTSLPQEEFRNIAAAASIALLILLLTMNAVAVILRNRFSRRV
ncbi:MAG TPA: phosphate ABC transporter permease PstA [Acidimicrobiia bacterium]|nr:phosphate ABC transporter permease PstA [Acidimicrobiia bacterium]